METIGPVARRNATGPLRRLLLSRETPRPMPGGRLWVYATPLGLFALAGIALAAGAYLTETRQLVDAVVVIIAVGSVLPVALTFRLPVLAWRLGFLMLFIGSLSADPTVSWPWNVAQILGFLAVHARLAVLEAAPLTFWATALSLIPVFTYAPKANAWGAAVLLVAIAALGDIVSRRRRTSALLAEKEELNELERAKRAVLEERTRIAREMHDVVAHHMSMIAVRAETAPYRVVDLGEGGRAELATIATAARTALADMRRLLGVLRAEDGESPRDPQPGLPDLPDLVATAQAAGVEVTLEASGLAAVPPTTGLAAYRIVQEALANAARHAPGEPVAVGVRLRGDGLAVSVRNHLPRSGAGGSINAGHGLVGMRERATLLGGSLRAGPDGPDFLVLAVLPLDEKGPA